MLSAASSCASDPVNPSIAILLAVYSAASGIGASVTLDVTFTTTPDRHARNCGLERLAHRRHRRSLEDADDPDACVVDEPQASESIRSERQNVKRHFASHVLGPDREACGFEQATTGSAGTAEQGVKKRDSRRRTHAGGRTGEARARRAGSSRPWAPTSSARRSVAE
jgi:hypothetical protein